ncbi:predicted protein [Histoplasma capsulatum var. duboisii H88]|uniref:Predicted protein n=1 Tax=Ajellomyces capsulatus (strain H88) TaxID=544711 RepID=F0UPC8_AJEC8|nr:predicted protein [Histoplasma capsulatum var. duboisii H88]
MGNPSPIDHQSQPRHRGSSNNDHIDIRINHTDEIGPVIQSLNVSRIAGGDIDRYPVGRILTFLALSGLDIYLTSPLQRPTTLSTSKAGDWPELPSRLAETRCLPDAKGQPTADSRQPISGSPADSGAVVDPLAVGKCREAWYRGDSKVVFRERSLAQGWLDELDVRCGEPR